MQEIIDTERKQEGKKKILERHLTDKNLYRYQTIETEIKENETISFRFPQKTKSLWK